MIGGFIIGTCFGVLLGIVFTAWCQSLREQDDAAQGFTVMCGKLYKLIEYRGGENDVMAEK